MNFVTGGTGLVGAVLAGKLINRGEEVTALVRSDSYKDKFIAQAKFYFENVYEIFNKINWVKGDLLDIESLELAINRGDNIYHCAAMVSFNPKYSAEIFANNVDGTANIVNVSMEKDVRKFCHVSSIGALGGKVKGHVTDENTPWSSSDKSVYSLSKYYSEMEVWRGIAEGLNAVIVNPAVILGAGESSSSAIFHLVKKGIKYYTLGSTSYVDVKDVTEIMIKLMESKISAERFILASETYTYKELLVTIAKEMNVKIPDRYAGKMMTFVAYLFDTFYSSIIGKEPQITKQTHRIFHVKDNFSGDKVLKFIDDFLYTPVDKTIRDIVYSLNNNKNIH